VNATTRIKRPTYATPNKLPTRMVHQSTNYAWVPIDPNSPAGAARFVKVGRGITYRRPK
jgi:hypothetical protein